MDTGSPVPPITIFTTERERIMPNDFNITAPIRASEFVKDLLPIGTRVRSFDFPCRDTDGENACFMEGTITGFQRVAGCLRYVIRVERAVFGGKEQKDFPRNVFHHRMVLQRCSGMRPT